MIRLTPGNAYEFEWWSSVSGGIDALTTATAGNSVTLAPSPSGIDGEVGQFAIGTFTADSTSQVVTFASPEMSVLNGFQLRTSAVPQPTTTALLGLGLLGVMLSRRAIGRQLT
jgi:hypothetical protein